MTRWLLPALLAGCTGGADTTAALDFTSEITPTPNRVGPATLSFTLAEPSGTPVTGAQAKVEANMTHPGMVPVFATSTEPAPGRYEVPFEFTMGGDWYLLVDATLPDGRAFHRQIDVPAVRAN
ncbi:MAG: FixH family protein [Alphaproteobacteria bacterium]|nr:FixH family protein [Alphaproteobacteria bacterium]